MSDQHGTGGYGSDQPAGGQPAGDRPAHDQVGWVSPGASAYPTPPTAAGAGSPPGAPSATVGPPGMIPGWAPPPKPGLVPLRPLDLGTILGAAFRVLRRNPKPTFGAALLIQGSAYLLLVLVVAGATFAALSRIDSSTARNAGQITAGGTGLIVVASIIPALLSVIATAVLQGIIVLEVSRGAVGEKSTFRGLWARARGRMGALVGWAAMLALASTVLIAIVVVIILLLAFNFGIGGIIAAVVIGMLAFFGLTVIYVWLGTKLALVPSVLMIERMGIRSSIARSWSLTTGYFWRTLGITALVAVIVGVVNQVVSLPLRFIAPIAGGLADPQGQGASGAIVLMAALSVLAIAITVVFLSITSVVQSATTALIYLDLRIRKEGLDLELARYVETKQTGDVSDPLEHGVPANRAPANGATANGAAANDVSLRDDSPWV
ncbi:hypothetical protein [Frigoribacterium sp. CG_9.8]|uniref:hypothetical protein n=1 Tax=Frigoribacterium sp. CG_9.8 TaxID=2787733 RepID=UPI0018CAC048|nr:hypothetical protein [Frigoribacterium sp. CG_9.8]MBG6106786.1 hypothetical protein [Frigoribacterium sp. CG_9.8]